MSTYKITNITHLAGKREVKYNSTIDIEYVDEMSKKIISVKPNETVYLTVPSLPLSVHRLRVKNLITVMEISTAELTKLLNDTKPKVIRVENTEEIEKKQQQKQTQTGKKKVSKKEEEIDIEKDA
jgi:hypothetical protein